MGAYICNERIKIAAANSRSAVDTAGRSTASQGKCRIVNTHSQVGRAGHYRKIIDCNCKCASAGTTVNVRDSVGNYVIAWACSRRVELVAGDACAAERAAWRCAVSQGE